MILLLLLRCVRRFNKDLVLGSSLIPVIATTSRRHWLRKKSRGSREAGFSLARQPIPLWQINFHQAPTDGHSRIIIVTPTGQWLGCLQLLLYTVRAETLPKTFIPFIVVLADWKQCPNTSSTEVAGGKWITLICRWVTCVRHCLINTNVWSVFVSLHSINSVSVCTCCYNPLAVC